MKQRELFFSDTYEAYPAKLLRFVFAALRLDPAPTISLILPRRGKCSVKDAKTNIDDLADYSKNEDNFFYFFAYNPETRRLISSTKGEIRIGPSHQVRPYALFDASSPPPPSPDDVTRVPKSRRGGEEGGGQQRNERERRIGEKARIRRNERRIVGFPAVVSIDRNGRQRPNCLSKRVQVGKYAGGPPSHHENVVFLFLFRSMAQLNGFYKTDGDLDEASKVWKRG